MADIPAGTGLGSSGSFTVGVLKALHSHVQPAGHERGARRARLPHRDRPPGRAGRQAGPVRGGHRWPHRVPLPSRRARSSLDAVDMPERGEADARGEPAPLLHRCPAVGVGGDRRAGRMASRTSIGRRQPEGGARARARELRRASAGDLDRFAELLTEQWRLKLERAPSATCTEQIDDWIRQRPRRRCSRGQADRGRRRRLPPVLRRRQVRRCATRWRSSGSKRSASPSTTRGARPLSSEARRPLGPSPPPAPASCPGCRPGRSARPGTRASARRGPCGAAPARTEFALAAAVRRTAGGDLLARPTTSRGTSSRPTRCGP